VGGGMLGTDGLLSRLGHPASNRGISCAKNTEFNLIMRLYWPKASMLDGSWKVPPVQRLP